MFNALSCDIVPFSPHQDGALLPNVIECYQQIFAGEPWNEWLRCRKCMRKFGTKEIVHLQTIQFSCCGENLSEFWPASEVALDLMKEMGPEASVWIALRDGRVIGFCWGYPMSPEKLQLKLGLEGIADAIRTKFPGQSRVAYQDDMGILPEYRHRGIASKFFERRLEDFRRMGLSAGVVRTKTNPPTVTYDWFTKKLGYKVIGEYQDDDRRVVLACGFEDLPKK